MVEGARKGDVVGTLFGVAGEDDVGGVVFGGEEFKGGGIFEGVYGVLLGELYSVGFFEGVLLDRVRLSEVVGESQRGAKELTRSPRACRVRSLVEVPDSSSVFLWFSTSFASRSSSTRLERALRGFLRNVNFCSLSLHISRSPGDRIEGKGRTYTVRIMVVWSRDVGWRFGCLSQTFFLFCETSAG